MLLLAARAGAATLVVDGSAYATISDAVSAASDGDIISIAPGTWYDCVNLDGKSLTLTGAGGSAATTLDAGGACGAVDLADCTFDGARLSAENGADVAISGGTYANTASDASVTLASATLTVSGATFADNVAAVVSPSAARST